MDFVAIDFETANRERSSACALGIVVVKNLEIVEKKSWLIRPKDLQFDPWNIKIHGITEDDVINQPEFDELWSTFNGYLDGNTVIAHNASFDMSVLRCVLDEYDIPYPSMEYLCTCKIAEKVWPGRMNYRLDTIASMLDIRFKHHDACEDATAAAQILIKACNELGVSAPEELSKKIKMKIGKMFSYGYTPCSVKMNSSKLKVSECEIYAETDEFDENSPFFNKKVIFTGTLHSMTRHEAMQKVVNFGGIIGPGVTKDTSFLVLGEQDYSRLNGNAISSKMKKALELIEKGTGLQIISEDDFLRML